VNVVLKVVASAVLGITALATQGFGLASGESGIRTVEITIHHSRFTPAVVDVKRGSTVRFVVRNTDPIGHELIVGDREVHRRHETGTEPAHAPRPGEVTVPAQTTAETTFRFDKTLGDTVVYACHLPGHLRYGMVGEVDILAS